MSAGRHSNSCFQLLLKPEIRPHTTLRSSSTVACLHTLGDRQHTHALDAAAAMEAAEKRGPVPALGASFAASSAPGQQRCSQVPHTSAGHCFTRAADQAVHSHHSQVSRKQLLTDLKNYPVYLHPSLRYRGRWAKPICSLDDPVDVLKSTHTINHCYQLWSKQGVWEFQNMLQETISSPPELTPLDFLFSPFAGISKQLAHSHFLLPIKCT